MWVWTVFISSFLAATILPLGSEVAFIAALQDNESIYFMVLIATIGNTLGGMTNYLLGWFAKWAWLEKYARIKRSKVESLSDKFLKHGSWLALLCWLPIVGDPLAVMLGLLRFPWLNTVVLMAIGKGLRYIVLAVIWAYW
jgi:membrane protein YqaA with SNARE-associated domain